MTISLVVFVLLCLGSTVSCHSLQVTQGNDHLWNEYKNFFNKNYSPDEDTMRKNMWNSMIKHLFNHNLLYDSKKQNFSMGINEYSDMSNDEFKNQMMSLKPERDCQYSSLVYQPPDNPDIPDNVDYRDSGYVTHVRNQGICNACWAFVTIGSLEGQHKRVTGQLITLSEQQLIDCSDKQGNHGCRGGQMCRALEYAANTRGITTEHTYPYVGVKTDGKCHFGHKTPIGSVVGGYLDIPTDDEDALKAAVGLIGPVAAGLDASPPSFRHYKEGIYSDHKCSNKKQNHAVTIVGYGTENGKDYWLVKNSWGTSWGQNGFGKLARNQNNHCGIASRALFPVLDKNSDGTPKLSGPAT